MNKPIKLACEQKIRDISTSKILPLRKVPAAAKKNVKYRRITASIQSVGIIEPLVVFPHNEMNGHYMLLDGHIRFEIVQELEIESVPCLIATDDEAFTYNHKVNQLSAIQEHFMILTAIKNGVSEEEIARTLDVDVYKIRQKRDLLEGICPEAVALLKEKRATANALRHFRKVKPMRQIEMAELMRASNNFSVQYAKCLLAATPAEQLVDPEEGKQIDGLSSVDVARMEREMDCISEDFKQLEDTYGKNVLKLVVVVGYIKSLIDNARVVRYLAQHYPELLHEFQKLVDSPELAAEEEAWGNLSHEV